MKRILGVMLACVVSMPVASKGLVYLGNQVGKRIVLTDQPGCRTQHMAYAMDAQGMVFKGCWTHDNKAVYIKWVDLDKTVGYPMYLWTKMGEPL